jgi:hypothetical protein
MTGGADTGPAAFGLDAGDIVPDGRLHQGAADGSLDGEILSGGGLECHADCARHKLDPLSN